MMNYYEQLISGIYFFHNKSRNSFSNIILVVSRFISMVPIGIMIMLLMGAFYTIIGQRDASIFPNSRWASPFFLLILYLTSLKFTKSNKEIFLLLKDLEEDTLKKYYRNYVQLLVCIVVVFVVFSIATK